MNAAAIFMTRSLAWVVRLYVSMFYKTLFVRGSKIASCQKQAGLKIDPAYIRKMPMPSPSEPPSQPTKIPITLCR
jgi:hypothetical protein